ncbi:hypothetical protein JXB28_06115 [Candidatus Woesearchaeota archaeon]|nr:hypothetical protein [Candidatus Woesearchaeota archaeon]
MNDYKKKKVMKMEHLEAIIQSEDAEHYDEKYIVVQVKEEDKVRHVLVSFPMDYHSEIARAYQRKLDEKAKAVAVRGGGIITVDKKEKKVRTYGMSGSYGGPDISLVGKILAKAFPDFSIDAKVTAYVRG